MRISRIKIENYRSIKSCEFMPSDLCALVGENGAGKSNILSALNTVLGRDWLSANSFKETDRHQFNPDNDITIEVEFDPVLLYKPFKFGDASKISALRYRLTRYKRDTKKGKTGDPRLETACLDHNGKEVLALTEAPKTGQSHKLAPLVFIPQEVKDQVPLIYVGTDRRLADQMPSARASLLRRLLTDVDSAMRSTPAEVEGNTTPCTAHDLFVAKLREALDTLRIPEFMELEKILQKHSLENLGFDPEKDAERLRFKFDFFDSMDFFKAIKLVFQEEGFSIEATQMGEGAQNALVIAIFQAYEQLKKNGAIFLIEEPEMYLHPHQRRFFFDTLRNLSKDNQVIYTTHSPEFVSIPEFNNIRIVSRDSSNTTEVRVSTLKLSAKLKEKLRKELDAERNELFFARHVILVEGDTEKHAIPEYARRMSLDLNRLGCSVVEVSGKRNLKMFAELVSSLGIPYTMVFDTDSSDFDETERDMEEKYNSELLSLSSETRTIVALSPTYETMLRRDLGEKLYHELCQKYAGYSKAIKGRLIALDSESPVPDFVKEILKRFLAADTGIHNTQSNPRYDQPGG